MNRCIKCGIKGYVSIEQSNFKNKRFPVLIDVSSELSSYLCVECFREKEKSENLIQKHTDGSEHNFKLESKPGKYNMTEIFYCVKCGLIRYERAVRSNSGHSSVKGCQYYPLKSDIKRR